MEESYPPDLVKAIDFHGHLCPGLLIGYRASLLALHQMGLERSEDEELVTTVYTNSCAADAVQVLTGCTFGKGNLIFEDLGKHVFLFTKRGLGRCLRVALRYGSLGADAKGSLLKLPAEKLYKTEWIESEPPPPAKIYPTIRCTLCGEGVMEPRARVRAGQIVCLECARKES